MHADGSLSASQDCRGGSNQRPRHGRSRTAILEIAFQPFQKKSTPPKPMMKKTLVFLTTLTLFTAATVRAADKLVINSNQSNPAGKALFTELVEEFKKQNPDLEVVFNTTDHEGYKTAIRNWLTTEPPDIVFWFSGNRMKAFVDRGLFDDVSDLWTKNKWDEEFKTTLSAMTVDGKQWGIPTIVLVLGCFLSQGHFRETRHSRSQDMGGIHRGGKQAQGKWDNPFYNRHERRLDPGRLV